MPGDKPLVVGQVLAGQRRVILMGPGRYGKTTLLLSILYDYASQMSGKQDGAASHSPYCEETRIPLYLDVGLLASGQSLDDLFERWCSTLAAQEIKASQVADLLATRECLVLLDHMDRLVGRQHLEGLNALRALMVDRFPQQRYVLALPEHEYPLVEDWLPPGHVLHLMPLSEEDVLAFLHTQVGESQARRIVRLFRTRGLWEMGRDPLFLSAMMAFVLELGQQEPCRADILARLTDNLLAGLEKLKAPLEKLALRLEREGPEEFEWSQCQFDLGDGDQDVDGRQACRRLLGAGVFRLVSRERGLAFCHGGVRQYLAGQALGRALIQGERLPAILGSFSPRWAEPLSLLYGSMPQSHLLLESLVIPDSSFEAIYLAVYCVSQNEPRAGLRKALHPKFFDPQVNCLLGRVLHQLGYLEEARLELEEALRFRPDRADMHYELAQVLTDLDKSENALQSYQRAASLGPPSSEVAVEMALVRARGQDPREVSPTLLEETLDVLDRKKAETHSRLAGIYLEAGDASKALSHAGEALRLVSSAPYQSQMGWALERLGNKPDAKKHFQQALAQEPGLVSALLGLGRVQEEEGNLESALEKYEAVLARDPQEPGNYLNISRIYRLKGQFLHAKIYAGTALDIDPNHSPTLVEMGALLEAQSRYNEAVEQLRRAIDLKPRESYFHYRLGWLLKLAGRLPQAEAELRAAIELEPGQADYYNQLGVVLTELERHREALVAYQRASEIKTENPLYSRNVGVALAQLGQVQDALLAFDRALVLCHLPDVGVGGELALISNLIAADAHSERGQILEKMGDGAAALKEYQRAVELMPTESAYRLRQALAYGHFNEPNRMLHILRRSVQMRPEDGLAHYHLGEALETMGQAEESLAAYRKSVDARPKEGLFWKSLGRVQRAVGQIDASIESLARAKDLLPGEADAHFQLGLSLESAGRGQEAEECYRRAAREDVNREEYWMALGRCCRGLGRLSDSQAALRRVLFLNPTQSAAHSEMAETLLRQQRHQEALAEVQAAIKGDPEVGLYHHQAARIHREAGQGQEALSFLSKAVELEPHRSAWRRELGELLEDMEEWENALGQYEIACQREPDSAQGFYLLGRLHHRIGRTDEALSESERAVNLDPQGVEARVFLTSLYFERGDYQKALAHCQDITRVAPGAAEPYYLAARSLIKLGRDLDAIQQLEQATSLRPNEPSWQRELGQVYAGVGRLLEAQQAYHQALQMGPNPELRRELAHLYLKMGWRQEAIKQLQEGLEEVAGLGPEKHGRWLLDMGDFYQEARDWDKAWAAYDATRSLLGDRGEVYERKGSLLVKMGRYQEAKVELEGAAARGYSEPIVSHTLSLALFGLGDTEGALRHAIKAAFAEPGNAQFQRHLGSVLRMKGDLNSAMNYLQRALDLAPADPRSMHQMGLAFEDKGDVKEALRLFQEAAYTLPEEPDLRMEYGRLLLNLGRAEESLPELQAAVEGAPDSARARFLLGRALEALGSPERAREQYSAAVNLDPQAAIYHFHLGKVLETLGDLSEALRALRQALDLEGSQESWHADLAALYGMMGETDQAGREYRRALDFAPPNYDSFLRAGAFYREGGLYREAIALLEKAVAQAPSKPEGHRQLGLARLEMGEKTEGLRSLQQAAELAPKDPLYQIELASAYRVIGEPSDAAKKLLSITKEWPGSAGAFYNLGLALADQRWYGEAVSPLSRAVELEPDNPLHRCALARSLVALGRHEDALAHLHDASASGSAHCNDLVEIGRILEEIGRPEEALGVYRHGLEKEPGAELYYQAARVLRLLRRPQDAAASLRAALSLEERAGWQNELGELFEEEGQASDALPCFQRASQLDPKEPIYHRNMGVALERLHRYEPAREALQEAVRLRPDYKDALGHLASVTAKFTLEREVKKRSSQH